MGISEVHGEGQTLTHSTDTTEDFLGPENGTPSRLQILSHLLGLGTS